MTDLENRVSELEYQVRMLNNLIMPFVEGVVALTQGVKKEEKEKKRTKRKEKEERSNTTESVINSGLQIGTTDRGNIDRREQIKSILPDLEQRKVRCVTIDRWLVTYPPIFIVEQINLALNWLSAKPGPPKKDYGRFFNNWLTRAHSQAKNADTGHSGEPEWVSSNGLDHYFDR